MGLFYLGKSAFDIGSYLIRTHHLKKAEKKSDFYLVSASQRIKDKVKVFFAGLFGKLVGLKKSKYIYCQSDTEHLICFAFY